MDGLLMKHLNLLRVLQVPTFRANVKSKLTLFTFIIHISSPSLNDSLVIPRKKTIMSNYNNFISHCSFFKARHYRQTIVFHSQILGFFNVFFQTCGQKTSKNIFKYSFYYTLSLDFNYRPFYKMFFIFLCYRIKGLILDFFLTEYPVSLGNVTLRK